MAGVPPIILETSDDWEDWIQGIRGRAIVIYNVWDFINPDLPTQPKHDRPPHPPFSAVKEGAQSFLDLTPREGEAWRVEYEIWRDFSLHQYREEVKMLGSISDLIQDTVSRDNKFYLYDKNTIWEQLRALKARFAPSDQMIRLELSREYARLSLYDDNQSGHVHKAGAKQRRRK
jgi:hypothetical protein